MIITELWIPGRPVTKGSLTVVNGIPKDTSQSKAWRRIMAGAIRDDVRRRVTRRRDPDCWAEAGSLNAQRSALELPYAGPVVVSATWWLPVPVLRARAGDIDKLLRNLLDALSAPSERTEDTSLCAGAIVDDNQVQIVESWKYHDPIAPGVDVKVAAFEPGTMANLEAHFRQRRATLTA